jgi:DNA-binding NtrC family response regulator
VLKKRNPPGGVQLEDRINILLVDDEETLLSLIQEVLEDRGYKVIASASSRAALHMFSVTPSRFDLVIADEKMPELSGTDLAEEILRIRPDIPFILHTDYPDIPAGEKTAAVGIRAIVRKSGNMRDLIASVSRFLDS